MTGTSTLYHIFVRPNKRDIIEKEKQKLQLDLNARGIHIPISWMEVEKAEGQT